MDVCVAMGLGPHLYGCNMDIFNTLALRVMILYFQQT